MKFFVFPFPQIDIFAFLFNALIQFILVLVAVLLSVALLTLAERKILAAMQKRVGPNVIGTNGLLQPIADGIKLLTKEIIVPRISDSVAFKLAPFFSFLLALSARCVVPFYYDSVISDLNLSLFYVLIVSSLQVYCILFAGWGPNSIYAYLGSLRSAAQMISYEVSIGITLSYVFLWVGGYAFSEVLLVQNSYWFLWIAMPSFLIFFISIVAETNRAPFDLPEAEGELVAGYNVEYSGVGFVLFFPAEYSNIIFMSVITSIVFLGGWMPYLFGFKIGYVFGLILFAVKIIFILFLFVRVRAAFPRYRYDQLMRLGWKVLLPVSFGLLMVGFFIVYMLNI